MRLLVDTHVFLWLMTTPDRLSPAIRQACDDLSNSLLLSVVSLWEIQIKSALGKLPMHVPLRQLVQDQVEQGPFELLPVVADHVLALDLLPLHHDDPFDRLLIAQAKSEGLSIASQDQKMRLYTPFIGLIL
jgi:PIN domain nuclease of toxin-antitoxin system